MIKKAIILAGGYGSRLNPVTQVTNKHLLPVFDKPMIYYSLSTLMECNIKNILIITNVNEKSHYKKLLGSGEDFGIKISYAEQIKPKGLPDAFILGKKFIGKDKALLLLGDNFFHGKGLAKFFKLNLSLKKGCRIFTYSVKNPRDYGVLERKKNEFKILEKPKTTKSKEAIVGIYMFDNTVVKNVNKLKPSKRSELEITDLINIYNKNKQIRVSKIGSGNKWIDTGNPKNLLIAANYVKTLQDRQNLMIGCPEEIAIKNKWTNKTKILKRLKKYKNSNYSNYLKKKLNKKN